MAEKKVNVRKSVIPQEGAAITENGFFEEATKQKSKPPAKSSGDMTVKKKSVDKESALKSVKKGKGPLPNSHRGKDLAKRKKRKLEMSEDFDYGGDVDELFVVDDVPVPCCVCGKLYAPNAPKGDLVIFDWGQCDVYSGWVHLMYCSKVRFLAPNDPFRCTKCE